MSDMLTFYHKLFRNFNLYSVRKCKSADELRTTLYEPLWSPNPLWSPAPMWSESPLWLTPDSSPAGSAQVSPRVSLNPVWSPGLMMAFPELPDDRSRRHSVHSVLSIMLIPGWITAHNCRHSRCLSNLYWYLNLYGYFSLWHLISKFIWIFCFWTLCPFVLVLFSPAFLYFQCTCMDL